MYYIVVTQAAVVGSMSSSRDICEIPTSCTFCLLRREVQSLFWPRTVAAPLCVPFDIKGSQILPPIFWGMLVLAYEEFGCFRFPFSIFFSVNGMAGACSKCSHTCCSSVKNGSKKIRCRESKRKHAFKRLHASKSFQHKAHSCDFLF